MSIIIITHDLGVISEMADEVVVMYAGEIVEKAKTRELFDDPKHPYTVGLMNSVPDVDEDVERCGHLRDWYRAYMICRRDVGLLRDVSLLARNAKRSG